MIEFQTISYNAGALAKSAIIKAAPGRAFQINVTNTGGSTEYLQIFDSATVPADASVPLLSIVVLAGATAGVDFGFWGRGFSAGITVCLSSTQATKTLVGTSVGFFDATYL